jgi:glycogen debranching enzyme
MEKTAHAAEQYAILAASARDDTSIRVLKQGETFAVFDKYGDLYDIGNHELGLYHEGTRYLSKFDMFFGRQRPLLLSSTIHKGYPALSVNLTNPDICAEGKVALHNGTLHLVRNKFLYEGSCYERVQVSNYGSSARPRRSRSRLAPILPTCSRCAEPCASGVASGWKSA